MKKLRNFLAGAAAALLGLLSLPVLAEDIDLFTGPPANIRPPNLLLVIANAAHSSRSVGVEHTCRIDGVETALSRSAMGVEQCALYNVISALDVSAGPPVNLGVMMYNDTNMKYHTGADCHGTQGGCLVYPLTPLTAEKKAEFLTWVKNWGNNVKANSEATGAAMQEAWAYYYGRTGLSGRSYADVRPNIDCKNFVVFIGDSIETNSTPGEGSNTSPKTALEAAPDVTTAQLNLITLDSGITPATTMCGALSKMPNSHENSGFYADEWARYMNFHRITTYTVGYLNPGRCPPDYPWLLSSMATNGGGNYFPTRSHDELVEALNTILSEVRSVNSVFAAVSLPVSVNSQGTYLNQVFIGMFRPDSGGLPRWFGNLKQYKMGFLASTGAFSLLDADNKLAISASGSEFIGECARSFWTPSATASGDGYWTLNTVQNCTPYPASANSPDGNMVEKGGQGYMLRQVDPATRVVTTCSNSVSGCTSLTSFDSSNGALTTTTLGFTATTVVGTTSLVNWARGHNNHPLFPEAASINGTPITAANMRPSSHGDVVHSRPAAVNFGTDNSPRVVVFYGGNDGMLRAINGNRTASITAGGNTVPAGKEFWSFVPPEFHSKFLRRYENGPSEQINSSNPKDYAMDGPITAYRRSNGDAWLFVGMRRGGRTVYAFNVDGSSLAVTLKWKIGCADAAGTNCNAAGLGDYTGMAQSWSPPQVFTAAGVGTGTTPLLIMGGGYDAACEDAASFGCASTKGRGFYVVDADSGVRQRLFATTRGVVADVTVVPGTDGHAKFIYGADLGGNLYRISGPLVGGEYKPIGSYPVADWVITTVASLGCDTATTCTSPPNRKFMFAPDVVVDGSDYVLLLGSGDREKPTVVDNATSNHFFMVRDRPDQGNSYLNDPDCGAGFPGLCLNSLLGITQGTTPSAGDLAAKKGWYLRLHGDEQVVTGAIAVFGTVYFTTHQPKVPDPNACVPNLGTSRAYGVKYTNAGVARASGDLFLEREDAGLAPDLVVGKVTLDNNSTVPFCIGCDGPIKPSQPVPPGLVNNPAKIRSYWYIQK